MTASPSPDPADPRGQAFAACVLPEVEVPLRVAVTLTAQAADAEDLVQDTLLRALPQGTRSAAPAFHDRHRSVCRGPGSGAFVVLPAVVQAGEGP